MPGAPEILVWLCAIAVAYLVGSIPFGFLLSRARGIDIREHGSRNVGATNVSRVLGRRLGLICFALDALKGALPVLAAGAVAGVIGQRPEEVTTVEWWLWLGVAAAAILGHMFSVFLRFSGGKGVATGFGAMLGMWPALTIPALGALALWLIAAAVWRYVSLASMLAAAALPALTIAWLLALAAAANLDDPSPPNGSESSSRLSEPDQALLSRAWPLPAATLLLAVIVIGRHRANIGRLRRGEEPRMGAASTPSPSPGRGPGVRGSVPR